MMKGTFAGLGGDVNWADQRCSARVFCFSSSLLRAVVNCAQWEILYRSLTCLAELQLDQPLTIRRWKDNLDSGRTES